MCTGSKTNASVLNHRARVRRHHPNDETNQNVRQPGTPSALVAHLLLLSCLVGGSELSLQVGGGRLQLRHMVPLVLLVVGAQSAREAGRKGLGAGRPGGKGTLRSVARMAAWGRGQCAPWRPRHPPVAAGAHGARRPPTTPAPTKTAPNKDQPKQNHPKNKPKQRPPPPTCRSPSSSALRPASSDEALRAACGASDTDKRGQRMHSGVPCTTPRARQPHRRRCWAAQARGATTSHQQTNQQTSPPAAPASSAPPGCPASGRRRAPPPGSCWSVWRIEQEPRESRLLSAHAFQMPMAVPWLPRYSPGGTCRRAACHTAAAAFPAVQKSQRQRQPQQPHLLQHTLQLLCLGIRGKLGSALRLQRLLRGRRLLRRAGPRARTRRGSAAAAGGRAPRAAAGLRQTHKGILAPPPTLRIASASRCSAARLRSTSPFSLLTASLASRSSSI